MAQSRRQRLWLASASGLACALAAATPACAEAGYVGDLPLPAYDNSGATVWSGAHAYGAVGNPGGASILNQGEASGEIVGNAGVIRNAAGATWNGDLAAGANVAGADLVNAGGWNGALDNAGGDIDNSGTARSVNNSAGLFANEGIVSGSLYNGGQAANAGTVRGGVVNSSLFVNNAAGLVAGGLFDNGATTNNGEIKGGVRESGAFVNNASGRVGGGFTLLGGGGANSGEIDDGVVADAGAFANNGLVNGGATVRGAGATFTDNGVVAGGARVVVGSLVVNGAGHIDGDIRQTGGATTNNGAVTGDLALVAGAAVNNGSIDGAVRIGANASMIDNGTIGGRTINQGVFVENGAGALAGRLVNGGQATVDGDLAGGAVNRGALTVNASGRIENGLVSEGGTTVNHGMIAGGAVVVSGLLISTGSIAGGLDDAGLVEASGEIAGPIVVTGRLLVGGVAPSGAGLTIAPGSLVTGALTVPVDLASGASNRLVAKGTSLADARLDLTGQLHNTTGAYWGSLSLSDTPIALTEAAKHALAAASGPLYAYADPDGEGIVQTINPGLGVTASQVATATALAFAQALSPPGADFEPAPVDPTPNVGAGAVWSRGFGASFGYSGDNRAGGGPSFDATKLTLGLAGAEVGLEYGLHNIENSAMSLSFGLAGGDGAAWLNDRAGSSASARVEAPFAGAYALLTGNGFTGRVEARYFALDMRLTNAPLAVFGQTQSASGVGLAAYASYRIPFGALFVEPELGLSTTRLAVADEATDVGELAFGATRLTLGEVGAKVGGVFVSGALDWRPYALAQLWREGRNGGAISVPNGPTFSPSAPQGFEQAGVGVSWRLARSGVSGFAQTAWTFGGETSGIAATGGLRFGF